MSRRHLPTVVLAAALTAASCGGGSRATESTGPGDSLRPVVRGAPVVNDTMADDSWGWLDGVDTRFGTIEIRGGDQVWTDFTGRVSSWVPARLDDRLTSGDIAPLRDVIVTTHASVTSGRGVAGVTCRLQPPGPGRTFEWYEFVVRNGFAAIRRANDERPVATYAETDRIEVRRGAPVAVQASCIDTPGGAAELSLSVDGRRLLAATVDRPLPAGRAGLVVWTFPEGDPMNIAWHDFAVDRST